MLSEILNILENEKTYSLQEIADLLKSNSFDIKAKLEYLENMGYIKRVVLNTETRCSEHCKRCKENNRRMVMPVMWGVKRE